MPHPLEQRVGVVRRRARALVLAIGLSWFAVALVGGVLLAGLIDYWLHLRDPGVRLIISLGVLALCGWAGYRYLIPALKRRLTDAEVARQIERRFPQLNDRLASTINFLAQDENDPTAGSAALRRAVVHQTTQEVESLNLLDAIEWRGAKRAMAAAAGVAFVALLLTALSPTSARLAVARLLKPLGSDAWPKQHDLEFVDPPQWVASGQPFRVDLKDRQGHLPDEVHIHYRTREPDGTTKDETVTMQQLGQIATAQRDNVTRPFEYRAEGGDDDSMPWLTLSVVEPPHVKSLKITLTPPAYTGWPTETSPRRIRALHGTLVAMSGTATKRLVSAKLKLDGGGEALARLSEDGTQFTIPADDTQPLAIDKSGAYWFELVDHEGIIGGAESRWEIRAVPDQPPNVSLEQPAGNLFLTPEATLPLKVVVKDDLAIHTIALHYSRSDRSDQGDFSVSLYSGPDKAAPPAHAAAEDADSLIAGDSRVVEQRFELAPLELKPGTQLNIYATAEDYSPQTGQSPPRQITIITAKELTERLARRQEFILAELARVLKMQQEVRGQTTELEIQLRDVGQLTHADQDRLQGAELNQRQVTRSLASPTEGVVSYVRQLLSDLHSNRVDNADVERRMQSLLTEIDRLNKDVLPPIERELTSAVKDAQSPQPQAAVLKGALVTAGTHQDQVIASLQALLGDLSQWENYRRFARDVEDLRRDQEALERDTAELGKQTLTKDRADLEPQQQADLKKLGQRQADLARRFDRVQQQMEEAAGPLRDTDPLAAETLGDAVDAARRNQLSGQMRESGQRLEQNQMGQAGAMQKQVGKMLQEMLDILANRREQELSRLVKRLREAEQQLGDLRARQEGLRKKTAEAGKIANEAERRRELQRLSREQQQLQQEAERFARQLQRLQAEQAARAAAQAGSQMGEAGQADQEGNAGQAGQDAAEAMRDLDEAQQRLVQRRKQAERDLAQEEVARVEDALKSLHERQQKMLAETQRLEELRVQQGRFTRAQAQTVQDLARNQDVLRDETATMAKKITSAEVFALALQGATGEMARSVAALTQRETGAPAQQAEQAALVRLGQLLEAMGPDKNPAAAKPNNDGEAGGGGDGKGKSGGAPRDLAEIKLLKLLQQAVNERTQSLQRATAGRDKPTDDQQRELVQLAQDQGKLAEVVFRLSQPTEPDLEQDPDKLPDLRLKEVEPQH